MARSRLSRATSAFIVITALHILLFLALDAVGFTASNWVGAATSRRFRRGDRCVCMEARRGDGELSGDWQQFGNGGGFAMSCSRRSMLRSLGLAGAAVVCGQPLTGNLGSAMAQDKLPTVGKITKTGVKYFDYRVGEGSTPRWGQDCIVRFVMYGRSSPDEKLIKIHSSDDNKETYVFKHGNGLQIKGMEEGIHSMRVGGKRRVIMPQQLGYVVQGLGPYPADPRKRDVLVKVLTAFEGTKNGELVMDVDLLEAFDDEADQGYYEDETVSVEELQDIVDQTGRFSGGMPFEKLPGQVASPLDDGVASSSRGNKLPGQLGQDIGGT